MHKIAEIKVEKGKHYDNMQTSCDLECECKAYELAEMRKKSDIQLPSLEYLSECVSESNEMSLDSLLKERLDIYEYILKTKERLHNNEYADSIKAYKVGEDEYILRGFDKRPQQQSNFALIKGNDVYCWSGNTNDDGHLNEFMNNERMIPGCNYHTENATYTIDSEGRVVETFEHHDTKNAINRNDSRPDLKSVLNGKGRHSNDVGGHIVAHNVDGVSEAINIVPMNKYFNNAEDWKSMENDINGAYQTGKESYVHRHLVYEGDSLRPSRIDVEYEIEGQRTKKNFNLP